VEQEASALAKGQVHSKEEWIVRLAAMLAQKEEGLKIADGAMLGKWLLLAAP
jgi:hypothetical protein